MRHPRILDVLGAVREVAAGYPDVTTWWYAPPPRLRLSGELSSSRPGGHAGPALEVAIEGVGERAVHDRIADALSARLRWAEVSVRSFRGDLEERPLFRLLGEAAAAERRP